MRSFFLPPLYVVDAARQLVNVNRKHAASFTSHNFNLQLCMFAFVRNVFPLYREDEEYQR